MWGGRYCVHDRRITIHRIAGGAYCVDDHQGRSCCLGPPVPPLPAVPDGCRRGFLVCVAQSARGEPDVPVFHFCRTLAEAIAWARRHWRPDFLVEAIRRIPPGPLADAAEGALAAVIRGEHEAFFGLLDALEEAGALSSPPSPHSRVGLTRKARLLGVLPEELPPTEDERQEKRRDRKKWATVLCRDSVERRDPRTGQPVTFRLDDDTLASGLADHYGRDDDGPRLVAEAIVELRRKPGDQARRLLRLLGDRPELADLYRRVQVELNGEAPPAA
jgi:hypothetical protein